MKWAAPRVGVRVRVRIRVRVRVRDRVRVRLEVGRTDPLEHGQLLHQLLHVAQELRHDLVGK